LPANEVRSYCVNTNTSRTAKGVDMQNLHRREYTSVKFEGISVENCWRCRMVIEFEHSYW